MSGLTVVASGAAADAIERHVPALVSDQVASHLFAQDATLWGPQAQEEAAKRLSWVGLARSSRPLVGEVAALREDLRAKGVDRVVLCGMGGSSLAPEVICATAGVPLVVLDSSHPDVVRRVVGEDLERTVVVVSSKSGSTVETDSQRRVFEQAFRDASIDPAERLVVVTDPGSPLEQQSRDAGLRVITADPGVGGRYSALTAFGLVPSGLAGADIELLLDEAEAMTDLLAEDDEANPGLRLGAALGGTEPLRGTVYLVEQGSGIPGFGDWAEQLIAESTGKEGTGLLPVVLPGPGAIPPPSDATVVRLVSEDDLDEPRAGAGDSTVDVAGSLGAQLLLWEVATAVAGRLLGINPFDQPDVESAKAAARELLDGSAAGATPADLTDGEVQVRALGGDWLGGADSLEAAVAAALAQVGSGYLAVMAYLDREEEADLAEVADDLAIRVARPVTFGWGPRFLHSTGQYHKGGPATGVYLQITEEPAADLEVPGRDFSLGQFIAAQADGDARVLADRERPVLQLHLTGPGGLEQVRQVLSGTSS